MTGKRLAPALLVAMIAAGCTGASISPSARASPTIGPGHSADTSPLPTSSASASVPAPSPSPVPPTVSASLPVHGDAREMAGSVQMAPGPAGDLYVYIASGRGSILAMLDASGRPRTGWPIALVESWCSLPAAARGDVIHLVCASYDGSAPLAYAFGPDGRGLSGWPAELPGAASAVKPVVAGDELSALLYDDPAVSGARRIVAVGPGGTVRTGARIETPDSAIRDSNVVLGPDGAGYLLAYPITAAGDTEITSFDLGGVRAAWRAEVNGWPSGLSFGGDGLIYVTEGQEGREGARILAFDRDGRPVQSGSGLLPVTATAAYSGAGPFGGAPPPIVSGDGMMFLVSEASGTTIYAVDAAWRVPTGWPYRDDVGLQWSYVAVGETGTASWRSDPAVGPDGSLYLLHRPRAATLGGSIVAIGPDGTVRAGWPVVLQRPGAVFRSVVVGPDGTVHALAVEPEGIGTWSATILAIASDSTVLHATTIIEP